MYISCVYVAIYYVYLYICIYSIMYICIYFETDMLKLYIKMV